MYFITLVAIDSRTRVKSTYSDAKQAHIPKKYIYMKGEREREREREEGQTYLEKQVFRVWAICIFIGALAWVCMCVQLTLVFRKLNCLSN